MPIDSIDLRISYILIKQITNFYSHNKLKRIKLIMENFRFEDKKQFSIELQNGDWFPNF